MCVCGGGEDEGETVFIFPQQTNRCRRRIYGKTTSSVKSEFIYLRLRATSTVYTETQTDTIGLFPRLVNWLR